MMFALQPIPHISFCRLLTARRLTPVSSCSVPAWGRRDARPSQGRNARTFRVLTPVAATYPCHERSLEAQIAPVTPFPATHTKSTSRKSFPCHTSEKTGGWGLIMVNHAPHARGSTSMLLVRRRLAVLFLSASAKVSQVRVAYFGSYETNGLSLAGVKCG
jgi:hypothetical protein